jgi:hypothetical protein
LIVLRSRERNEKKLIFDNIPAPNPSQQIPNGPDDLLTTTNYHHMEMLKDDGMD